MYGKLIHWSNHICYSFITGKRISHYLQIKLDEKSNLNEKKVKDKKKDTTNTLKFVKMACALSNTARLLKYCSRNVMKVNLRFCSSESKYGKSNANFTSFTTKASGFQDFEKTPSLKVIASIIINGASIPPNSKLFLERLDATELIEGSLHAVEAVTQAISSETYGFSESSLNYIGIPILLHVVTSRNFSPFFRHLDQLCEVM